MTRFLLFDLDDTLYPPDTGLMDEVRARVLAYVRQWLGLDPTEAEELRRHYLHEYGTTLRGLQIRHQIEAESYLSFVHDLPLEIYLRPNPDLGSVLGGIPLPVHRQ